MQNQDSELDIKGFIQKLTKNESRVLKLVKAYYATAIGDSLRLIK